MNHILFSVSMMCLVILLLIFLLKKFNQPYMVAYILAGILIGPFAGKVFTSTGDTASLGEIGILLLMFFLGMEIDIPDHHSLLLKPVIAQGIKMLLGITISFCLGRFFHSTVYNILLLAILFVFNSTAVVSEYLAKNGELHSAFGKSILISCCFRIFYWLRCSLFFNLQGRGTYPLFACYLPLLPALSSLSC